MISSIKNFYQSCKRWFNFSQCRRELYNSWEQAAQQGDTRARYRLLMLYYEEKPEYYPMAFKWALHQAKHGGDCGVSLQVADMYVSGHGTQKDEKQALLWYERALSQHILLGKRSPLSVQTSNYIQQQIESLRKQYGFVEM